MGYCIIFLFLFSISLPFGFQAEKLLVLQEKFYFFSKAEDYFIVLKDNEFSKLPLKQSFPFYWNIETDGIFIYILDPDYIYFVKPTDGKISSKFYVKNRFRYFTRDEKGNFYFLFQDRKKILKLNFVKLDSVILDFSSFYPIQIIKARGDFLFLLSSKGLYKFSLTNSLIEETKKGNFDNFFLFGDEEIALQNKKVLTFIKGSFELSKEFEKKILDCILLRDTLFILFQGEFKKIPIELFSK